MSCHNDASSGHAKDRKSSIDLRLGQQLRKLRILRGYSQEAIASKIGITFQQLQKYERGINRVCVSRLVDICKFFCIPPSYFVDSLSEAVEKNALHEGADGFIYDFNHDDIDDKEMLALMRAYKKIPSVDVRKKVISLIRSLGAAEEN